MSFSLWQANTSLKCLLRATEVFILVEPNVQSQTNSSFALRIYSWKKEPKNIIALKEKSVCKLKHCHCIEMRENSTFEQKTNLVSFYITLPTNVNNLLTACGISCGNGHCGCDGNCVCDFDHHVSSITQACIPGTFSWFISLLRQTQVFLREPHSVRFGNIV